jgi:hypothetical protein
MLYNFSYRPSLVFVAALVLGGCSVHRWDPRGSRCNSRAYINAGVQDYLSSRGSSPHLLRAAFPPIDVPERFAFAGRESGSDLGRHLGAEFQRQFQRTGLLDIAELQDERSWSGRREDFDSGNYEKIERARRAGYDLLMLGALRGMRNAEDLVLSTKVIDVKNDVTVWSGDTVFSSPRRAGERTAIWFGFADERRDLFYLNDRLDSLVSCAVDQMLRDPHEPESKPRRSEQQ